MRACSGLCMCMFHICVLVDTPNISVRRTEETVSIIFLGNASNIKSYCVQYVAVHHYLEDTPPANDTTSVCKEHATVELHNLHDSIVYRVFGYVIDFEDEVSPRSIPQLASLRPDGE